jgi:hypothetical protein
LDTRLLSIENPIIPSDPNSPAEEDDCFHAKSGKGAPKGISIFRELQQSLVKAQSTNK